MMRLSELLGREVVTESGERLGHVRDVRARVAEPPAGGAADRGAEPAWSVVALMVGRRGLLARLGVHGRRGEHEPSRRVHDRDAIAWEDVKTLQGGRIVVRDR